MLIKHTSIESFKVITSTSEEIYSFIHRLRHNKLSEKKMAELMTSFKDRLPV